MAAQRVPAVQAAVRIMKDEGVDIVFGCPGAALLPLYTAMEEVGGVEHYAVRHEEAAAHMADGWARTGDGRVGVAAVASGPGAARLVTGLYAARQDAVPLVCVTGRPADGPRRSSGSLRHGAGDSPDLIRLAGPVTKRAERIEDPARIPGAFREAFRIAREGRPGPVLIDVPADVAAAEIGDDAGSVLDFRFRQPACRTAAAARPDAPGSDGAASPVLAEIDRILGAGTASDPAVYVVSSSPGAATAVDAPRRRHHLRTGTGLPGWEVPAAIGVRKALESRGERDAEVVAVIEGHGLSFLAEELSGAARYGVPFVLLVLTPGHPGSAPAAAGGHPHNVPVGFPDEQLTDHVKLVEAYGCAGRGVADPADLRSAVEWARKEAVSTRRPVLVEVPVERAVPAARGGPVVGAVREYSFGP
ncbi:thiamine pyrophosphate-binding protein [Streptomyces sp. NPDC048248]|uniref:thiamine pyrophosphate-binding protein n=1 Tax=Streptomyces sp. NPDC048248 TaxID=3365523 RepID=UPI003718417D